VRRFERERAEQVMKASLVSATSIAALLALEAGPTMAGPEFSLSTTDPNSTCSNVASPSTCTLNLHALPGQSSAGVTVTMTADVPITGTQTFSAAPLSPSGFSGTLNSTKNSLATGATFTSNPYSFSGASTAGTSGLTSATVGAATATVTKGTGKNSNGAQTSTLTLNGYTVAPIQSVSSTNNAGFVLVGQSGNATITVTNNGHGNLDTAVAKSVSNLNGSVGAGNSVFVGGGTLKNAVETGLRDGTSQTFTYVFTPPTQSTSPTTTDILTKFTNGNSSGSNAAQTVTTTLSGQGVAPVQQVSSVSPVYARAGGSSVTSTVTVNNVGNGNLATGGPSATSNLNGSVSAITGTNWTGGVQTFSIQDNTTAGSTSKTFSYTYGPQARGVSSSGALNAAFTNGNSNLSNTSQTVPVTLIGNTVGPIYKSTWPTGTDNTPPAGGTATTPINFGTVAAGSSHTQMLTLANITTDANGGTHTLTDLSIESFTITGAGASKFNVNGTQSGSLGDVLAEGGGSTVIDIGFNTTAGGAYNALLTFVTDQGAAFGAAGDQFSYNLTAFAAVASEPGSLLLLSVGLGGLLIVSRRQRQH
jgi:hypothetical protein